MRIPDLDISCLPRLFCELRCMEREHSQLGTSVVRYMYAQVLLCAGFISDFFSHPHPDRCLSSMARLRPLHYPPPLQDCHLYRRIDNSG